MRRGAFTLLEVVVALALGAMTIGAATALYLSVVEGWRVAERAAAERSTPAAARFVVQQGFSRAFDHGKAADESLGLARPGEDVERDKMVWFRGTGALVGHPELGSARFYLGLDEDEEALVCHVEPVTLEDDDGEAAVVTFPLLKEVERLHYWFHDREGDRWEETEELDNVAENLEYNGYPLSLIEIVLEGEPGESIWIRVPPWPEETASEAGGGEETPAEGQPAEAAPAGDSRPVPGGGSPPADSGRGSLPGIRIGTGGNAR